MPGVCTALLAKFLTKDPLMSKFFQSLEEERTESKKKSAQISERNQEKLSKKDLKMKELKGKVEEVQGSGKSFDKLFKKFMNEVRRYTPYFEANEVPGFLAEFFSTQRVTSSKQMSAQVQDFLSSLSKPQESLPVGRREERKKERTLETVMSIESDKEREEELVRLLSGDRNKTEEACCEILVALFSIYSRGQNPGKMIETLESISKYLSLDNTFTRIVKRNLDVYLGKIYDLIDDRLFEKYSLLLSTLESVNKDVIEKRLLELQFSKLSRSVENSNPLFSLLFLVRNGDWKSALAYFQSHGDVFDDSKTSILILFEFAGLAARNREFGLAFEVFCRCGSTPYVSTKIEVFSLCVILNDKLVGNQHFESFLDVFKEFDENYLVLRSKDPVMEVCRAFYLLNMCDYQGAFSIINEVSGFECEAALMECASRIFEKKQ